jgi:hypothetical protein
MPAETNEQGWILHSHGQGRKFGPLTEDELRSYFRAGMVKSVDRLTPPGETAKHAAADVAAALGEPVPVGPPPPPEVVEAPVAPPPTPVAPKPLSAGPATPQGGDADAEERLARAMAAMNIDFATMMSATAPKKKGLGLAGPLLLALMLVVMLVIGLNMLRKLRPPMDTSGTMPVASMAPDSTTGMEAQAPPPPAPEPGPRPAEPGPAIEPAPPAADDAASQARAQSLRDAAGYIGQGNYADAEVALKNVLASSPNDGEARSMLAQVYQQSRRFDEAAALYKEMTIESPNDAIAWNNYGASLAGSGQPAQAVVALENAVRIDPTMKAAWTNLGNLYQQMGDSTKAKAAFANGR